jgi:hypothetical protein
MKLLKYLQIAFLASFFFVNPVLAQTYVTSEDGVEITAGVPEDTNSTLVVSPKSVEIRERATVTVTIRNSELEPISGHYIQLIAPGLNFTQPTEPTNSNGKVSVEVYSNTTGTYQISARDITYDNLVVEILDTDTLFVTPLEVPSLIQEPMYTKGTTNALFWNSLGSSYRYNIEVSESSTFDTVKESSGWVSGTTFEFENLENEVMYFYRVKARNSYGGESNWSEVRFSVQDSLKPDIDFISIDEIGDNDNVEWQSEHEIRLVFKVEDNLSLENVEFSCLRQDGAKYNCGIIENTGVLYTITLKLSELQRDGINDLFLKYDFCLLASDSAGNLSENCEAQLRIPEGEKEDQPQKVPTSIGRIITDVIDNTEIVIDDIFGDLEPFELQDITTTTTVATITISIGSLLGGLLYIPMYLFQAILGGLTWFGIRKRGQYSGYVYDSGTKEPISQAVVRVYDSEGRLVRTDVTGSRGLFALTLSDGKYSIKVVARGYDFPSKTIFGKKDYPLEKVYHGEEFEVKGGVVPEYSIPLDSADMSWFERVVATLKGRFRSVYKVFSVIFFILGLVFSVYTYNLNPTWFNFVLILLYIPAFVVVVIGLFKKKDQFGRVKDDKGNAVANVAVGLRDKEYEKIVAKRKTDGKGRYRFIVDQGEYDLEILDTEYEVVEIEQKENRILSDGSLLVALDIVVKPIKVEK